MSHTWPEVVGFPILLMAGLPVVTYMGNSFPSRVAGSLLYAAGIPELATRSLQEYETLALRLALNQDLRKIYNDKIAHNRAHFPLFDTSSFCFNLEAAYIAMWRERQLGEVHDEIGLHN